MKFKVLLTLFISLVITLLLSSPANAKSDPKLMSAYEDFKAAISCVPTITSAHRSSKKNKAVGGAKNSYHLKGKALDIKFPKCKISNWKLGKIATKYFNGVIVYKHHIHVDIRKKKYFGRGKYKRSKK